MKEKVHIKDFTKIKGKIIKTCEIYDNGIDRTSYENPTKIMCRTGARFS